MSTTNEKEEMNQLLENIAKNIEEMTKLDMFFVTEITQEATEYYWCRENKECESKESKKCESFDDDFDAIEMDLDDFSDIERQVLEKHRDLNDTLEEKYALCLYGATDENDKVRYGILFDREDKYTQMIESLLKENKYAIPFCIFINSNLGVVEMIY